MAKLIMTRDEQADRWHTVLRETFTAAALGPLSASDEQQLWRTAWAIVCQLNEYATSGVVRAAQLDAAVVLACQGVLTIADQVDKQVFQLVRDGIQRGLRWIGQEVELTESPRLQHSMNGGW